MSPFLLLVNCCTWMRRLLCGCLSLWESGGVRGPLQTWCAYSTRGGQISKLSTVSCMAPQGQSLVSALGIGGEEREQRGEGSCIWVLSRCWKGTLSFASYYICSLSFSSGVCGFVECEQLWLLVPDNSVMFQLSEAP